jgi:hypothetical protein
MRHICMVPSNTLSSTDASKFALKIIEQPIVRDYLSETHGLPLLLVAQVPNEEDWWDLLSKQSYADVLSKRHKGKPNFAALMADKDLPWPDLSTFNGPSILRFAFGDALMRPPVDAPKRRPGRSEIYEIKPNNRRGKVSGLKKLFDVEESYDRHRIPGIYRRGIQYPAAFKKTIYFETPYLKMFRYLVTLALKPLGVSVLSVAIEVERTDAGVLLYKICVDLEGADNYQKDPAWVLANFAVRMLWRVHTAFEKQEVVDAAAALSEALEPDDPAIDPRRVEWIIAGRDFRKVPYLTLKIIKMVTELESRVSAIRDAMYSRLIGAPGDRFFLCSDEAWYRANIGTAGAQKVAAQIKLLTVGSGLPSARGLSFIHLAIPILMTADTFLGSTPVLGEAYRWCMDHITAVLIVVGCSIVVGAALLATAVTAGAAAPIALPVAGEALSGAAAVGGGAMAAPIMTAVAGAEATTLAAAPTVGAATEGAAVVRGTVSVLGWARQALQIGLTEAEIAEATSQRIADGVLIKILSEKAAQAGLESALKTAPSAGPVVAGIGAALVSIGLSMRSAYAYDGPPSGNVSVAAMREMIQVEIGNLYILRVPKAVPTQIPAVPELYKKFNIDDYNLLPGEKTGKRELHMLGCVEVT